MTGILHVLYSLRAEGCPRLALGMLEQEIIQTGRRGMVAVCSDSDPHLAPAFEALGVGIVQLKWRRHGFVGIGLRALRLLRSLRPRGVICYSVGVHVTIAMAARSLRLPFVLHLGNSPPRGNWTALNKIRLQMLTGRPFVNAYAACSDYVKREVIREYFLPADTVKTIPNGIPLSSFQGMRRDRNAAKDKSTLVVGMVGSMEVHKDQETLIEAVALLRRKDVKVRLHLVGSGSRESYLRQRAQDLGLADIVEWAGPVNNVAAELAKMDVFAYSVQREEGLGIALVEAMAAGLPIVASDVGACREVLDNGRGGILVPQGNASAWADAIHKARAISPPATNLLNRYDIRETARAYDALLAGER